MKNLLNNRVCFLLSGILLTFMLADSAQAQTEKEVVKIRAEVAAINKGAAKYQKKTKNIEDISLEGTEATYFTAGANLKKSPRKCMAKLTTEAANFITGTGD